MDVADAEEYTQALGQVVAGGWRQIALGERLGVPMALGMTTREWVDDRLGGYVKLSIPERREAVQELTSEGMSQRKTAAVLGVAPKTVRRDQRDAGANAPADGNETSSDADIKEPPGANAPPGEPLEERIARLDDDLAKRVHGGLSIDEAELIQAQNDRRVDEWADRIRAGLEVLRRMAGHPIPGGIRSRLTDPESDELVAVLDALEPLMEGVAA